MKTLGTANSLKGDIRSFITDTFLFGEHNEELLGCDSFVESGVVDSTGIMELVAWIEETFDIVLDDTELVPENLDSVSRIEQFVAGKLGLHRLHAHAS